jgi:hypothetical protein
LCIQENLFKMEKELTKKLKKTIEMLDQKFSKDKLVEEFEKSSTEFEILVEKGLIKKRGNNALSILDRNSTKVNFNTL